MFTHLLVTQYVFLFFNYLIIILLKDTSEGMLKAVLLKVFELAGSEIDHIPPVMVRLHVLLNAYIVGIMSLLRRVLQLTYATIELLDCFEIKLIIFLNTFASC